MSVWSGNVGRPIGLVAVAFVLWAAAGLEFARAMDFSYAHLTAEDLKRNSALRSRLFKNLQVSAKQYTFDYIIIELPAGSIPGIEAAIPVSYVRYSSTVFFGFNKFTLETGAETAMADFAKILLADRSYKSVLIVGHTDSIGPDDYNQTLSKNRAQTVATTLKYAGVPDNALGVVPMGEAQPFSSNSTAPGRALNRRVEFFISDIPDATKIAIEKIPVNPCFRNDHEPVQEDCAKYVPGHPPNIPIFKPSGERRPGEEIELTRAPLPPPARPGSDTGPSREPLPHGILERPSLRDRIPQ